MLELLPKQRGAQQVPQRKKLPGRAKLPELCKPKGRERGTIFPKPYFTIQLLSLNSLTRLCRLGGRHYTTSSGGFGCTVFDVRSRNVCLLGGHSDITKRKGSLCR